MADRRKLAQGLMMMTPAMREDLASREQDIQRGKTVELLRRAGKEMYENPIVNTAIGFTPGVGDVQAAGETFAALQRGAPWQETAGYAVGMLPFVPALRTTWHGSPHGFTKFDMSKIGTGEGAQAYGHGLYLAEARPVAEEYATNLSKDVFNVGGELFNPADIKHLNVRTLARKGDIDSAINKAAELAASDSPVADLARLDLDLLQQAKAKGGFQEAPGYLYKVDLPDEQIAKMLDWDKTFSEQPKNVQDAITKYWKENRVYGDPTKLTGEGIYGSLQAHVLGNRGVDRANRSAAQEAASMDLNYMGVPGIQYLDQASRDIPQNWTVEWPNFGSYDFPSLKEAESFMKENPQEKLKLIEPAQQTRNYVVFSDEIPQILERNGQPVAQALRNYEAPKQTTLQDVVSPIEQRGVTLDVYESNKKPLMTLSRIEVPKEMRGQGVGTQAMQDLVNYANQQGKTIALSPSTDFGGTSVGRLKDFYKQFGFVENKGRNKDFEISESMYRLPETE